MRSQHWQVWSLWLLGMLIMTGCGGGSGNSLNSGTTSGSQSGSTSGSSSGTTSGSDVRTTALKVTINWAERTRSVRAGTPKRTVSAPGSALSALLTVTQANPDGNDFHFLINRPAALTTITETYASSTPIKTGTWKMSVALYAQANGSGSIVARADTTATIQPDGTGIGEISTVGTVASVAVAPTQALTPGQKMQLGFTAYDSGNGILPLTPGSAHFAVASGGDKLSVTADGMATALASGTATITATVDGKSSSPLTITIRSSSGGNTNPALNWTQFRGDAAKTGRGIGSGATGTILWTSTYPFYGARRDPIIGLDGTLYLWTSNTNFSALDSKTGQEKWTFLNNYVRNFGSAGGALSPDSQIVYVPGADTAFYALNTSDGSIKWSIKIGTLADQVKSFSNDPTVAADGTVYTEGASSDGIVYALDGASGNIKWTFFAGSPLGGSPAVGGDGMVYITSVYGKLFALNPANGAQKWSWTLPESNTVRITTPAVGDDGTVYLCATGCYAIDGATGQQKWFNAVGNDKLDAPTVGKDGTIYVGNTQEFFALDGGTGATKWHVGHKQGGVGSSTVGIDGTLYTSDGTTLNALDAANGQVKWGLNLPCGTPILANDGTLYTFGGDTTSPKLYAVH